MVHHVPEIAQNSDLDEAVARTELVQQEMFLMAAR
jgi:hypothetical protein